MLEVRQRLGDFEVIRLLGKGGMGEVYEALQLNPPRPVALKVLKGWLAEDDEALHRFWREAAVPARLDHPGIVRIIATGKTEDGIAYYAMQLVRGLTLAQLIHRASEAARARTVPQNYPGEPATPADNLSGNNLFLPPAAPSLDEEAVPEALQQYQADRYSVVVRVGIQAARALASAHKQDVLHRDIKPSNLMIDHHGQLYVVDFGLTRALVPDGLSTRPGTVCGTPWYMSPEQARGDEVDGRSDLFSLGVTLYELAAGGAGPYTAERRDNNAILREVRSGRLLPLSTVAPGVPAELERIIHRTLRANPRHRYQTAEELAADLERLSQQPERLSGKQRARTKVRWPLWGISLGTAAALLITLLTLMLRPRTEQPPPPPPPPPSVANDSWPALPAERIERKPNEGISLLSAKYNPIWAARVMGTGRLTADPKLKMSVMSLLDQDYTLIALDDDPKRRWFDLTIRMRAFAIPAMNPAQLASVVSLPAPPQMVSLCLVGPLLSAITPNNRQSQETGIFFGYRHAPGNRDQGSNFFYVRLKEVHPRCQVPSQLLVGTGYLAEARGIRGQTFLWRDPFPGAKGHQLLPPAHATGWRMIRVRAENHKVSIFVDDAELVKLDLERADADVIPEGGLDPRGALGVWARNGVGFVESGTIAVLDSEAHER